MAAGKNKLNCCRFAANSVDSGALKSSKIYVLRFWRDLQVLKSTREAA